MLSRPQEFAALQAGTVRSHPLLTARFLRTDLETTRFGLATGRKLGGAVVPFFAGVWAIFGHGNVAGLGEALHGAQSQLPTLRGQSEQVMALAAVGIQLIVEGRQRGVAGRPRDRCRGPTGRRRSR